MACECTTFADCLSLTTMVWSSLFALIIVHCDLQNNTLCKQNNKVMMLKQGKPRSSSKQPWCLSPRLVIVLVSWIVWGVNKFCQKLLCKRKNMIRIIKLQWTYITPSQQVFWEWCCQHCILDLTVYISLQNQPEVPVT